MPSPVSGRRDFFISFNSADREWAEWIAAELESAGRTTFFQHWDFRPGNSFAGEMNRAAEFADRTIAVLTPSYISSAFAQAEAHAAFVQDPSGKLRKLIPIRVKECELTGIWKPIIYADLVGLSAAEARECLLNAIRDDVARPRTGPFPGSASSNPFPGGGDAVEKEEHASPDRGRARRKRRERKETPGSYIACGCGTACKGRLGGSVPRCAFVRKSNTYPQGIKGLAGVNVMLGLFEMFGPSQRHFHYDIYKCTKCGCRLVYKVSTQTDTQIMGMDGRCLPS